MAQMPQNMQAPESQDPQMEQGDDVGEVNPELQAHYEALNAKMNEMIAGNQEAFNALHQSYVQAQESGMLAETAGQNAVGIMDRLEQDVGPINEPEILMVLANDIIADVSDLFGLEMTPEEEERALAAAVVSWMQEHPDRVEWSEEDKAEVNRMLEENVSPEVMQQAGGMPPGGAPSPGMPQGGMSPPGGMPQGEGQPPPREGLLGRFQQ